MEKCFYIFLLIFVAHFNFAIAKVFSTKYFESQSSKQPELVELGSSEGYANPSFQRFKNFLNRARRSSPPSQNDPSVNSKIGELKWTMFNLVNDTTHNQALIHWSGKNSKVIFILTRKKDHNLGRISSSTLWRSDTYGVNFTRQHSKFDNNTVLQSYFVCPTNKSKVIFIDTFNNSQRVWVSSDEGVSYKNYSTGFSVSKIEFHPTQQEWLLGYDKTVKKLYVSQNLGKTWTFLHNAVTKDRYFWYIQGIDDEDVVHLEYRDMDVLPEVAYLIKSCRIPNCTATSFQPYYQAVGAITMDSLVVQNNYTFVQKTGARQKLYVSHNRGPFVKAMFAGANEQTDFHIVSSDSGTVVTGVKHMNHNGQTHLYFSDTQGKYFTHSLSNVRYFQRKSGDDYVFTVDIHEVKSVLGTFIANIHTPNGNTTKITNDNGRIWRNLLVPAGEQGSCTTCTLNLHVTMSQTKSGYYMPTMMSKSSIPGLVISHGSVGKSLVDAPSLVNLYVSNDAGTTWRKVLQKRHLFVAADHGSMLVAVQMIFLKPVRFLYFSNDLGSFWTKHRFSDEQINVDGLLTEPGEYTHKFTLFGHRTYRDHWKLFALDTGPLVPRHCQYPQDYANWTLTTDVEVVGDSREVETCHLGVKQTFERVNSSGCLVGPEYKRLTSKTVCRCSERDYECNFGYYRLDGKCKKKNPVIDNVGDVIGDGDGDDDLDYDTIDEDGVECVDGSKEVETNFRKIPGDMCAPEMPSKLYTKVPCGTSPVVPTVPSPKPVVLKLINKTSEAKIGEEIHFTVSGIHNFDLTVTRTVDPQKKVKTKRNKKNEIVLVPSQPGDYRIKASNPHDTSISDTLIVSFWYPIKTVHIYHPPVVEVNTTYNATVTVSTVLGMFGTSSLIGDVEYFWESDDKTATMVNNYISFKHSNVKIYQLAVVANNKVSFSSAHASVTVKEYVETVVLPFNSTPPLRESVFTHHWLRGLRFILANKILQNPLVAKVFTDQNLQPDRNLHVFVEPRLPLKATLHFSPTTKNSPDRQTLFQAATLIEKLIVSSSLMINLPNNTVLTVVNPYVINDEGLEIHLVQTSSSMSGGVIALLVILSILLVAAIIIVVRRYSSQSRLSNYFLHTNPRNISFRPSHIVRKRTQDRVPIVAEECVDDELDAMDQMTTDQGGTLQFRDDEPPGSSGQLPL